MKNLVRYKNRIYRRYATDIWGQIIMKGKVTRLFKFLLQVFYIKIKKLYLNTSFSRNKLRKKKSVFQNKSFIKKETKRPYFRNIYAPSAIAKMFKGIQKNLYGKFDETHLLKSVLKKKKAPVKSHSFLLQIKKKNHLDGNSFNEHIFHPPYMEFLNKWKEDFLTNLSQIYFYNYNKKTKKKIGLKNYLMYLRRSSEINFLKIKELSEIVRKIKLKDLWKGRKKRTLLKRMDAVYDHRNKLNSYTTWLDCERRFKAKKFTTWWSLRGAIRKISIFYGILSIKKFRYIESSSSKKTMLRNLFAIKLETMINVILFRSNLFSNIYFANNFIRGGGLLLNNKIVIYPFKFMKKGDILCINKKYFKRIFNIFFKKLFFSKKLLNKNKKYSDYNVLNATKLLLNYPGYLEINYKVLHIILWRLPYRYELRGLSFSSTKSIYDWSIDTETDYQD